MMETGRICIKTCGRDAGREAVILEILDNNHVLIDGNVRRRKCNMLHLEPTSRKIDIKKGASHEDVKKEFDKLNIPVWETKRKEKGERPRRIRGKKEGQNDVSEEKKKGGKTEAKEKKKPVKEAKGIQKKEIKKDAVAEDKAKKGKEDKSGKADEKAMPKRKKAPAKNKNI
ncbi:50S ribosomal protein L14e [Candidatus Woesearchaeota archaeon]|nr:50S ribosomal protein L14e [Candidatus Woesearchaeota archaeon]